MPSDDPSDSNTSSTATTIKLFVKYSNSDKISVDVDLSKTVLELKESLSEKTGVEPERIRLIYSGRVLKDPEELTNYGLKEGHTLHLVKGLSRNQPAAAASHTNQQDPQNITSERPSPQQSQPAQQQQRPQSQEMPTSQQPQMPTLESILSGSGTGLGSGGFLGAAPTGQPTMDPSMMASLMNNPGVMQAVQGVLQNPQLVESILGADNPLASVLTPELRRATQNLMSDPSTLSSMMNMFGQTPSSRGPQPTATTDTSSPRSTSQSGPGATENTRNTDSSNTGDQHRPNPFPNFAGEAGGIPPLLNRDIMQQWLQAMGGRGTPPGGNGAGANNTASARPTPAPPADARPPEERYGSQLQQLSEMGFWDAQKNVRALQLTGGNVSAAIEWLLNQP